MLQVGSGSGFVDEPLNLGFTGQAAGQDHLQGHVAVETHLPGPVHDSHAASPDLLHSPNGGRKLVRGGRIRRFEVVSLLGGLGVEREDEFAAASLRGPHVVALVGEQMASSALEKRPERSAIPAHLGEVISLDQSREEFLGGQVLRILGRMAPVAHIGIDGVPVRLAEVFKGLSGSRRVPSLAASTTLQWVVVNWGFWARPGAGVSVVGIMRREFAAREWSRPGGQVAGKQLSGVLWPMGTIRAFFQSGFKEQLGGRPGPSRREEHSNAGQRHLKASKPPQGTPSYPVAKR